MSDDDLHVESLRRAMGQAPSASWLRGFWESCAYCTTSAGTGVLAGHAGCFVTPVVTALAPWAEGVLSHLPVSPWWVLAGGLCVNALSAGVLFVTRDKRLSLGWRSAATALTTAGIVSTVGTGLTLLMSAANYQPLLTAGLNASIAVGVVGSWYALRGKAVSRAIRTVTVSIAAASLVLTTAVNMPHDYDMWRTYLEVTDGGRDRAGLFESAAALRLTPDQYLESLCSVPTSSAAIARANMSYGEKLVDSFSLR
jgi:hypothetical protein